MLLDRLIDAVDNGGDLSAEVRKVAQLQPLYLAKATYELVEEVDARHKAEDDALVGTG